MKLLTRADFDGIVCAVLLREVERIDSIEFLHPRELFEREQTITREIILAKLPYMPECGKWFHHQSHETRTLTSDIPSNGIYRAAPSTAHVIYEYYPNGKFHKHAPLVAMADKFETASFTREEIMNPQGWMLLFLVMDPWTGLGKFHHFTISHRQLMYDMVDWIRAYSLEDIFQLPAVRDRVSRYWQIRKEIKRYQHPL